MVLVAGQFGQIGNLHVQRETMSHKTKWGATEDDIVAALFASSMCMHAYVFLDAGTTYT